MTERYCPAFGPGSDVCPRSICDCFIEEFPDDMEQAGALHPEFFIVRGTEPAPSIPVMSTDEAVSSAREAALAALSGDGGASPASTAPAGTEATS